MQGGKDQLSIAVDIFCRTIRAYDVHALGPFVDEVTDERTPGTAPEVPNFSHGTCVWNRSQESIGFPTHNKTGSALLLHSIGRRQPVTRW